MRLSPQTAVGTIPHERCADDREIAWSQGHPARNTVMCAKTRKRARMCRILLPLDFSQASLRVIHQAAFLAQHFHSEIILLHVVALFSLLQFKLTRS